MSKYFLFLLALALMGAALQAQDKATLDLLVKKGVITQAEADEVGKQSVVIVQPKDKAVKKLTISGRIHAQFDYINTDGGNNPPSVQEFLIRRAFINVGADLGSGISGEVELDFAAGQGSTTQTGKGTRQLFNKVVISKRWEDLGKLDIGYRKVDFSQEEVMSSAKMKVVERSIATRFFTESLTGEDTGPLAFGNRHVGAYWEGETSVKGLTYKLAVANGQQSVTGFTAGGNLMSYWASMAYDGTYKDAKYTVGLNAGYSQNANTMGHNVSNDIFGINPYLALEWGRAGLTAECMFASVQNGRADGSDARPLGVNVTPFYRLSDQWEIAGRFSYLSTDGRGVRTSLVPNTPDAGFSYDDAYSVYGGFNWYIIGNSLKLSAGYEWVRFNGAQTAQGGSVDEHAIRTRLQLLF